MALTHRPHAPQRSITGDGGGLQKGITLCHGGTANWSLRHGIVALLDHIQRIHPALNMALRDKAKTLSILIPDCSGYLTRGVAGRGPWFQRPVFRCFFILFLNLFFHFIFILNLIFNFLNSDFKYLLTFRRFLFIIYLFYDLI